MYHIIYINLGLCNIYDTFSPILSHLWLTGNLGSGRDGTRIRW